MDLDWCLTCEKALEGTSSSGNAYCSLACRMRADPRNAATSSRRPADYLEGDYLEDEEEEDEDDEEEEDEEEGEEVMVGKFQLLETMVDLDMDYGYGYDNSGCWWNDEAIVKWARQIPSGGDLYPPIIPTTTPEFAYSSSIPAFTPASVSIPTPTLASKPTPISPSKTLQKTSRLALAMPIASSSSQTTPLANVRTPPNLLSTRRTVAPALSLTPLVRMTHGATSTLTMTPSPTSEMTTPKAAAPQAQRCARRSSSPCDSPSGTGSRSSDSPSMSRSRSGSSTDDSMVVTPGLSKTLSDSGAHRHQQHGVSIFGSVYSHLRFLFQAQCQNEREWEEAAAGGESSWEKLQVQQKEGQVKEAGYYSRSSSHPPPPPPHARKLSA